jgi:RND family efflux transporter MFP subunit
MIKTSPFFLTVSSGLLVMSLVACSGKTEVVPAAAPAATASAPVSAASTPAAPVTVTTVRAVLRDFPVLIKATGTVTPLTSVDVRAQVTSIVKQVHFKEGQFVKAGTLLFTLDSRTDEANLAKARAQLAKDQAALADAKRQLARAQQLLAQNFIAQGALDTAQTQVEAQLATVAADQAAIEAARVALSFGRITAPNAGRAGAVNVFAGSAVQANLTSLVTITQLDPIAVAYSLPQRHLSDALLALKAGGAAVVGQVPEGGTFNGRLQFVDNAVDPNSGTIKVKAVFDNRDSKLWPGAFIEVAQTANTLKDAVVVPQAALIQAARGTLVYVVEEGKAVSKPVQLLTAQNGDAAVTGIQAGDVIVLDGRQNLRPGTPVVERAPAAAGDAAAKTKAAAP